MPESKKPFITRTCIHEGNLKSVIFDCSLSIIKYPFTTFFEAYFAKSVDKICILYGRACEKREVGEVLKF